MASQREKELEKRVKDLEAALAQSGEVDQKDSGESLMVFRYVQNDEFENVLFKVLWTISSISSLFYQNKTEVWRNKCQNLVF